ncbi:transposase [Marinococcus halophilus]|uniref:IS701 family transposase n=1 Tax=Marinococcus halophilus TaxID=1371 RepID=UPI00360C69EC
MIRYDDIDENTIEKGFCLMSTVSYSSCIANAFDQWNLRFFMSAPAARHMQKLLEGWTREHRNGSVKALQEAANHDAHHSSVTRFFRTSRVDDQALERKLQRSVLQHIRRQASSANPVLIAIDDTVVPKSKPSSQAHHPMDDGGYHFDHQTGTTVYGHQWLTIMAGTNKRLYPYHIERYEKEHGTSKIDLALQQLRTINVGDRPVYVLADSWYASEKLTRTVRDRGWHFIGAIKSNRVLETAPMPLPARDWAQRARQVEKPDLVTVRATTYEMVRFQGRLKGGLSGVVVGSRAFASHEAYRFFFSTDSSMTAADVLSWYQHRWAIETFFQEAKGKLSMGGYRLRSAPAIRRYLLLLQTAWLLLAWTFAGTISEAFHASHQDHRRREIADIYQRARAGATLESVYKTYLVA